MKRLLARAMSIALIAWLGVSGLRAQGPKIIPGTIMRSKNSSGLPNSATTYRRWTDSLPTCS